MAGVKTTARRVSSVPGPQKAQFVHGSWPQSARAPAPMRIKPGAPSEREYGKETPTPFGNTGLTQRS